VTESGKIYSWCVHFSRDYYYCVAANRLGDLTRNDSLDCLTALTKKSLFCSLIWAT
jgi:hypothetical protein